MIHFSPAMTVDLARMISPWWHARTDRTRVILASLAIVVSTAFLCVVVATIICASNSVSCIDSRWMSLANVTDDWFPTLQAGSNVVLNDISASSGFNVLATESISIVNPTLIPHDSFVGVYDKSDQPISALSNYTGSNESFHKRYNNPPTYNEQILCLGTKLKSAIDDQDTTYLQESPWQDFSIMYNEKFWQKSPTNGRLTTLDSPWVPWMKETHANLDPELITYYWTGIEKPVMRQMWKSYNDPVDGIQIIVDMFTSSEPIEGWPYRASDQLFLQWKQASSIKGDIKNIRWIGIQEIVNGATWEVLKIACPESPRWPGCEITWENNPKAANALLGSPNGRFIGWMLLQHPEEFPRKTIVKINTFTAGVGIGSLAGSWYLLFEIGSLPPPPEPEQPPEEPPEQPPAAETGADEGVTRPTSSNRG